MQQQIAYLRGKGKKPVLSDSEDDEDTPKKATPKKATPKKETPSKDEATYVFPSPISVVCQREGDERRGRGEGEIRERTKENEKT